MIVCSIFSCSFIAPSPPPEHLPLALCSLLDLKTKDTRLVARHMMTEWPCMGALTCYNIFFNAFLGVSYLRNRGAIPYPWYYDMTSVWHFIAYFSFVNVVIILFARFMRRALLARVTKQRND